MSDTIKDFENTWGLTSEEKRHLKECVKQERIAAKIEVLEWVLKKKTEIEHEGYGEKPCYVVFERVAQAKIDKLRKSVGGK